MQPLLVTAAGLVAFDWVAVAIGRVPATPQAKVS